MSKPVYGYEVQKQGQTGGYYTKAPPPNPRPRQTDNGSLPAGCTISPDTGTLTWTTDVSELGLWKFRVTATDSQGASAHEDFTVTVWATTDANGDYYVNTLDLILVAQHMGESGDNLNFDVNQDGTVNILDLIDIVQDML